MEEIGKTVPSEPLNRSKEQSKTGICLQSQNETAEKGKENQSEDAIIEKSVKSPNGETLEIGKEGNAEQNGESKAKPPSLFTFGAATGEGLFANFGGKPLFATGQPSLFTNLNPAALFSREPEPTASEGEEPAAAEQSEDEAELRARYPILDEPQKAYQTIARKPIINFRVENGEALGGGYVSIEQSVENKANYIFAMRNKTKNVLYQCFLFPGLVQTAEMKGKPGLSLFGYKRPTDESEPKLKREIVKMLFANEEDAIDFNKTLKEINPLIEA